MSEIRNTILQLPPEVLARIFDGTTSATFSRTYLPQYAESAVRRELRWMRENPSKFPELARLHVQENALKPATAPAEKLQFATFSDPPEWARDDYPSLQFPASPSPLATDWLKLSGDFAIFSDTHIPYHDPSALTQFANHAYRVGIKRALCAGDLLDANQVHPKRGSNWQHERKLQDDIEVAKEVFRQLLKVFSQIYVILGNHDNWLTGHMRGQMDAKWLFGNLFSEFGDRVVWSEYEQCEIESSGKRFRVVHGANYSGANPLGVMQRLAAKFESGVIGGHQHHAVSGMSLSGKHQVVCMGGMYDPARLFYVNLSPRTQPAMTRSYVLLKDGYAKNCLIDAGEW